MTKIEEIKARLNDLIQQNPNLRKIDQAEHLGLSEASLLSVDTDKNVTILGYPTAPDRENFKNILHELEGLGYIMALTRNEACVHERKGYYKNVTFYGGPANMGVAVNPDIDIRYFMNDWHYCLAVILEKPSGILPSLQFFNKNGRAVHKVFITDDAFHDQFYSVVAKYKSDYQGFLDIDIDPNYPAKKPYKSLADVDADAFRKAWLEMKDTHDFYGLLGRFGLKRTDAFEIAPEGHSTKVDFSAFNDILSASVDTKVPVMCFVQNTGCVQIHTGEIFNLKEMGPWYNILDPEFNMHLRADLVESVWIARKCTEDGLVTSIELFDKEGELIVYFFGARKPGVPELENWRQLVSNAEEKYKGTQVV